MAFYSTETEIEELVHQFSTQTLPVDKWTHEAHLTVALYHIYNHPLETATCYLRSGIIIYNHTVGTENSDIGGYHETITVFWIKVISNYIKVFSGQALITVCNDFLESEFSSKDYAFTFYSREMLLSKAARAFFINPDIKTL